MSARYKRVMAYFLPDSFTLSEMNKDVVLFEDGLTKLQLVRPNSEILYCCDVPNALGRRLLQSMVGHDCSPDPSVFLRLVEQERNARQEKFKRSPVLYCEFLYDSSDEIYTVSEFAGVKFTLCNNSISKDVLLRQNGHVDSIMTTLSCVLGKQIKANKIFEHSFNICEDGSIVVCIMLSMSCSCEHVQTFSEHIIDAVRKLYVSINANSDVEHLSNYYAFSVRDMSNTFVSFFHNFVALELTINRLYSRLCNIVVDCKTCEQSNVEICFIHEEKFQYTAKKGKKSLYCKFLSVCCCLCQPGATTGLAEDAKSLKNIVAVRNDLVHGRGYGDLCESESRLSSLLVRYMKLCLNNPRDS
jgi:hypothetical protein